jgi:hypothetical protein
MIHITTAERIELRSAELAALCGYCAVPSTDSWAPYGNAAWVQWCGKVAQYNPERGWSHGCTAGKRIGTKIKTAMGTFQALASRLP